MYGQHYPEPYDPGPEDNPTAVAADDVLAMVRWGPHLHGLRLPPLRWAVPGLIPEGLTLLVGPPKMGKSWLMLDIGLAVAAGGVALGVVKVEQGTTLYLALEDGERRLQSRSRLLFGDGPLPERFAYLTGLASRPLLAVLAEFVSRHPDTKLIVIDTLGRVRPPSQSNGDKYGEDYRIMGSLQQFAIHHRLSLVVVHHTRKAKTGEDGDFLDSVSGTHGLAGAADVVAVLQRARGGPDGTLRVTARDFQESDVNLRRAGPAWVVFDGVVVDPNLGDDMTAVVTEVSKHPDGVGPKEVAVLLGLPDVTVRRYLVRAAESGHIQRVSRGLYVPVTSVTSVLAVNDLETHRTDVTHTPERPS